MVSKNNDELVAISVPTKKIDLEVSETEKIEIILRPFKQRHFARAIAIINQYFDSFNSVRNNYLSGRKAILEQYPEEKDEKIRLETLNNYDAGFNEGMEIAKAILSSGGDDIAGNIKAVINMSIHKATLVVTGTEGTERSPIEPELDDLTWGECLVLLGSVVGLNMDFFNQNTKNMNLNALVSEPSPNPKPKAGAK